MPTNKLSLRTCLMALALSAAFGAACLGADGGAPSISARPNPVWAGTVTGQTQISWDTGDGSWGQVYVSVDGGPEAMFAAAPAGSQGADWISSGRKYEFRLYRGDARTELLAAVEVTRRERLIAPASVALLVALLVLGPAAYFGYGPARRRLAASPGARRLSARLRSLDPSYGSALYAFALTRFIVLAAFLLTVNLSMRPPQTPGHPQEPSIVIEGIRAARRVGQVSLINDAGWYSQIAREGYDPGPYDAERQHNWAFFPLYPLVWRYASRATGELPFTGMALSNVFFLVALVLLHRLVRQFGFDAGVADRTVFYLAAFPSSYFFSLPWTESLFLCLSVACVYSATRGRWWTAGALGALSTATRFSGVYLIPVLLIIYLRKHGRRVRPNVMSLALIPLGLLSFAVFLHLTTGNALAFKDILVTWGRRTGFFLDPLADYLARPYEVGEPWNFKLLNFTLAAAALACVFELFRRRQWALAFYALVSVFTPLSTTILTSFARYLSVAFPIHIALAAAGRSPRVDQLIRALSIAALALMSALFAANNTLAGA